MPEDAPPSWMKNAFITGTDTGVGKTYVTERLVRDGRRRGWGTIGFKPICCGSREDAEALHAAADGTVALNEVNPVWLRTPAAPYAATMIENRVLDLALVRETFAALRARFSSLLVEGVGGWLVPITRTETVADLAADFGLPVVIVVANRLGALNHAALTVHAIRSRGLHCAGLIVNDPFGAPRDDAEVPARATNRGLLEDVLGLPILREVGFGEELGSDRS